jgi:hypothetical protein
MKTVQEIIKSYRVKNPGIHYAAQVEKVLMNMEQCGTASMGYHLYRCTSEGCSYCKVQYHSCHDRHCPRCGSQRADEWVEDRQRDLLPCMYYHLVFTVPHELNSIFLGNMKVCYDLLFKSVSETLMDFALNPRFLGATPGIIAVLHTWGQNLSFHPHLHCIITGGGTRVDGRWKQLPYRSDGFLFPVKALRKMYRGKLLDFITQKIKNGLIRLPQTCNWNKLKPVLYNKTWNVYAKSVMTSPMHVIDYLGRYTHKVAISNHRIIEAGHDYVRFKWRDYRDGEKMKEMSLPVDEFVGRLALHILPKGFVKIRQYGIWSYRNKSQRIAALLQKMNLPPPPPAVTIPFYLRLLEKTGTDIFLCPKCKNRSLEVADIVYRIRSPEMNAKT